MTPIYCIWLEGSGLPTPEFSWGYDKAEPGTWILRAQRVRRVSFSAEQKSGSSRREKHGKIRLLQKLPINFPDGALITQSYEWQSSTIFS